MDIIENTTSADVAGRTVTIVDDKTPFLGKDAITPFYCQGIRYKTLSHFIECQKALHVNAYDIFHAAHRATTAERAVAATRFLAIDYDKWYRTAETKVQDALLEKYSQNYGALSALTSTGDNQIIYCDQEDGYWGNGLKRSNPANTDEASWPGKNRLGVLTARVRSVMRSKQ